MSTQTTKLANAFTVSAVAFEKDTDVYLNVLKRKETLSYLSVLGSNAANISFLSSSALSSEINLSIADRSTSLEANRIQTIDATVQSGSNTFSISTDRFVVTNVFTDTVNTVGSLPIFYKHIIDTTNLPRTNPAANDFSVAAGSKLVQIQLLDQSFQPIKVTELKLDTANGFVYTNLLSEFSSSSDFTVYYVQYTVNNNGTINTFTEMLDSVPVFRLAEFSDLDGGLQIIDDGRQVYLIEETITGFDITLGASITEIAFKPLDAARIQVVKPVPSDVNDEWFVRITNGRFFTNINAALQKFRIAEFLSQIFNPEPPIKFIDSENAAIVNTSLIKLNQEDIFEDTPLSLFVNIQVNDATGSGVVAFTTDSSLAGTVADNGKTYEIWDNTTKRGIRSIDHRSGILDIEGITLKSTYTIEASYYYEATRYEYTIINFNPVNNSDAATHRYTLFVEPEDIGETKTQTLFFLKSDKSGRVVESNWTVANGGDFDNSTQLLTGGDALYLDIPTPAPSYVVTPFQRFAQDYSVEGTGTFLILADVTTSESASPEQLTKIDVRSRGGGIPEASFETTRTLQPEIEWYWDEGYWDGIPYPGNASYLLEVPVKLLNEVSGVWTPQQIRNIADRHTAAGVYPVIRAYGPDITVSGIETDSNSITLKWVSHGY